VVRFTKGEELRESYLTHQALGVANLTPIAGGYISDKYGWRMQFYILIAFTAAALLCIILGCPDHGNYSRSQRGDTDVKAVENTVQNEHETKTPNQSAQDMPSSGLSTPLMEQRTEAICTTWCLSHYRTNGIIFSDSYSNH
jgi:hypothetical protein